MTVYIERERAFDPVTIETLFNYHVDCLVSCQERRVSSYVILLDANGDQQREQKEGGGRTAVIHTME